MNKRGQFSSRLGFILAAAGAAVGLGNIWGFPTQVASNGGGAFVLVYLVLTFALAYPILMVELTIGRFAQANMVGALQKISPTKWTRKLGTFTGLWGMLVVTLILSFYAIIAGWMIAYFLNTITQFSGLVEFSAWLVDFSLSRNIVFCVIFSCLNVAIVCKGVTEGIERWSSRLMPMLLILIVVLIIYVATLDGAAQGWRVYLVPDFSKILDPQLLVSAMGQAFFSLSLGVGAMLIYGSYVSKQENLPELGASVALIDSGIAILAGMLIIPAMYVAQHNGVTIFTETGDLIDGDRLIFKVIPQLFGSMGAIGNLIGAAFFLLMAIAALTSSISMLEVPVAYAVESRNITRHKAAWLVGAGIMVISLIIMFNFELLFSLVIKVTTEYSQPMIGFLLCVYAGWIWHRNELLTELSRGCTTMEASLFWKIWPYYVRIVCPVIILVMFYKSVIGR